MDVKVKLSKEYKGIVPKYAKEGDAGIDLMATEILSESKTQIVYSTGFSVEVPEGYVAYIYPRSSIRNKRLVMANSVGVVDSGYRGEIQCTFVKTYCENNGRKYENDIYQVGDRICQIIIEKLPNINFIPVQKLSKSIRGKTGHGSTN
jgi:dUTP pyrophosphatase